METNKQTLKAKSVYCKELTSNKVQHFKSIYACAKHYNVQQSNISNALLGNLNGKYLNSAFGVLVFSRTNDFEDIEGYYITDLMDSNKVYSFIPEFNYMIREVKQALKIDSEAARKLIKNLSKFNFENVEDCIYLTTDGMKFRIIKTTR